MSEGFVRLHLFLGRHRWAVGLAVILFAAGALWCSRRLRLNEDYTDMLPMSDPAIAEPMRALRYVRQAERLFVDVQTAALEPERLGEAADRMHAALREIPELGEFRHTFEAADLQEALTQLQAELPGLLTSNDLHELEARWQNPALEQRLVWMKKAMIQPQGLLLKNVVQTDPIGLSDPVLARLRVLQAGVGDARLVAGRITSADGRHVLLSAAPAFRPVELSRSGRLLRRVWQAARAVEAGFPRGAVRIAVTGAHRVALDNATMIRQDSVLTSGLATVAVAGLMWAAYRRRWLALLGLVPTVFGALGALVVFYLNGDPVSAVALGCGSILIGVTVDYGIYILYRIDDAPPADRQNLARMIAQLAPTLAFGALTTLAAFLVMLVSPVSGHRQLGLFGAAGVALAAGFAMVILPLFVPLTARGIGRALPLTSAMQRLFAWRARHERAVWPLLLAFSLAAAAGVLRLRCEGDLTRLNGVTRETRRDEAVVREVWGKALSLSTVVVTGASRKEVLEKNERVCAELRALTRAGVVESFASLAPLAPSEPMRRANLRDWSAFWSGGRREALSNSLTVAATKLGFRAGTFGPFLEHLAASVDSPPAAAAPALDRLLSDYWSEKDGRIAVCTLVKVADTAGFRCLRGVIQKAVPGAWLLNRAALAEEIVRVARRALPVFAALVVGLNTVLLFLLLGRVTLVLITLLPMAVGMLWTLGMLGLLGQPIDMANFIFAIFVIGVGGDYSLFLVMAELEPLRGHPDRTASTGGAVTICAGTTLLGVGVLVLARHPAMFSLGLSAWLGISLTLLATLFLVPPCMAGLRRRAGVLVVGVPQPGAGAGFGRRRQIGRLYRYQGPGVEHYVYWKLRIDPLFRALDAVVPCQGHIFDAGCGYGLVAHWLALGAPGRTVHGVDHDPAKIQVARATARASPGLRFEQSDLVAAEWPPCDVVLLCDVLHYFPRDLKGRILACAFLALRPGGRLILREAASDASQAHRLVAWSERFAVWSGHNLTRRGLHFEDAEAYEALLQAGGFAETHREPGAGLGSNIMLVARKPAA